MLVEVCANSLDSALRAQDAGADRIELCSELGVGGITPSYGLIAMVKDRLTIPVHVLIRPRSGHFTYSPHEFEIMLADIEHCVSFGVDGIVSGVLLADHDLDIDRTHILVERAGTLPVTFHRAFDWIQKPESALQALEAMGVRTVLTSGQADSAEVGLANLAGWQRQTDMTVLAGGGIRADNAKRFLEAGLRAIHCSATAFENKVATIDRISMNSELHLAEDQIAVTNAELLRQIISAVKPEAV